MSLKFFNGTFSKNDGFRPNGQKKLKYPTWLAHDTPENVKRKKAVTNLLIEMFDTSEESERFLRYINNVLFTPQTGFTVWGNSDELEFLFEVLYSVLYPFVRYYFVPNTSLTGTTIGGKPPFGSDPSSFLEIQLIPRKNGKAEINIYNIKTSRGNISRDNKSEFLFPFRFMVKNGWKVKDSAMEAEINYLCTVTDDCDDADEIISSEKEQVKTYIENWKSYGDVFLWHFLHPPSPYVHASVPDKKSEDANGPSKSGSD